MKTYAALAAVPNVVAVSINDKPPVFIKGDFSWGTKTHETAALSLAILTDLLGDRDGKRYAARFNWRETVNWAPGQNWMIGEAKIRSVIAAIDAVENETVSMRHAPAIGGGMPAADNVPVFRDGKSDSFGWNRPTSDFQPNVKPKAESE